MDIKENVGKQNTVFDWSMNVRDCFNNMGRPTNVITKETVFYCLLRLLFIFCAHMNKIALRSIKEMLIKLNI